VSVGGRGRVVVRVQGIVRSRGTGIVIQGMIEMQMRRRGRSGDLETGHAFLTHVAEQRTLVRECSRCRAELICAQTTTIRGEGEGAWVGSFVGIVPGCRLVQTIAFSWYRNCCLRVSCTEY
jgi:hypothetical protein